MTIKATNPDSRDVFPVSIEDEMRRSYLDYAMSVIVSRALPDVRDGLKPVHRRILYSMYESGFEWNKAYRKSARVVGDVMGKYHPHGDSAIYDAMVRMAQSFSMRLPQIDGQGNFGSMDGDRAAAMRYTEARLAKAAHFLLDDIDKETVDFRDNYDETTREPAVLPARYPNMLVNGAGGIAVGMATNIPPHNLGEVIDGCMAYVDNPDITIEELMEFVPGPDFPTGALILGRSGILSAFRTGRGSVMMRAKTHFEEVRPGREAIIVTEVPYQVNKAALMEKIADLVRDKKLEGISDLRDESDRSGVRMVIELKRDAVGDVVLNQLFRFTALQTSFGVNMLALNRGKPILMGLKEIIQAFVEFREEVITRRTIYLLKKARERAHVLVGLGIAVANIDDVIKLIRNAPDPAVAREQLMATNWPAGDIIPLIELIADPNQIGSDDGFYKLSETQARAILELRLHRLTGLEREKIASELTELGEKITDFLDLLASRDRKLAILKDELLEMRNEFANDRRTEIVESEFEHDIEDLIAREEMVVTVSHGGYIQRVPLSTYRAQRRGGKGRSVMATRDEDFISKLFVANTHTPVLFFSSLGLVYKLKVWRLPLGSPQSRGKALVNLLPLSDGEHITTVLPLPDEEEWPNLHIMFATSTGNVRRNSLADFVNVKSNGKIAMKLEEDRGDKLIAVQTCTDDDDIFLTTRQGKCIRFRVADVRVFTGRNSIGVRGVRLADGDDVIAMSVIYGNHATMEERDEYLSIAGKLRREEITSDNLPFEVLTPERYQELLAGDQLVLSVTENGYGKRTSAYEYRVTGRGGQGFANIEMSERNGLVAASFVIEEGDELMMVTNGGKVIRMPTHDIRIAGRKTQGVTLFRTADDEKVVAVERLSNLGDAGDDEDGIDEGAENETTVASDLETADDGNLTETGPNGE
ncbi:DNA gyrase subunit A [Thalassospira sp.]|uniref:DNA gyrase subunit A n=1 Tax=Thalassospira sp. TaxID=1912094 RepID=UPI0027377748|nr:DNA gyrase subunit A [Thalassospira sp.]MDP2700174.1 DNA gyrase subunit A [Thalassospira sp.]